MKKGFLFIISFSIIAFIVVGIISGNQTEKNAKDFLKYEESIQMAQKGENVEQAIKNIDYMQGKEKKQNYIFNLDKASIYKSNNEPQKALEQYKIASDINSKLLEKAEFLVDYADAAFEANDKQKARELIQKAQGIGIPENYKQKSDDIINRLG